QAALSLRSVHRSPSAENRATRQPTAEPTWRWPRVGGSPADFQLGAEPQNSSWRTDCVAEPLGSQAIAFGRSSDTKSLGHAGAMRSLLPVTNRESRRDRG